MDARPPMRRRDPGLRAACRLPVLLLALLVLCGSVDLHLGEEEHGAHGLQAERYTLGAAHPQLPPHIERGTEVERPRCAACLAQHQTRGVHLTLAQDLPPLSAADRLPAGDLTVAAGGAALRPLGRAPPLA